MKRASLNSHRQYNSVDEEARARLKHQDLLQEFFELQKEFISMKKKLQTVNQRRETLLAEVGFLRQLYSYLSMIKSQEYEYELLQDSVQSQDPHLQSKTAKNHGIERRPTSLPDLDSNAPLRKAKKLKTVSSMAKEVGRRKSHCKIRWL